MSERRYIDFTPPTLTKDEKRALATKRFAIQRRGRANPVSAKVLSKIAAKYDGPILRLPPGVHRGWQPSFMTHGMPTNSRRWRGPGDIILATEG